VTLRVDGRELTQSLTLAPDPRVDLPAAAYTEQFALARKVERDRVEIAKAGVEARKVLKGLAERRAQASGAAAAALDEFEQRAYAITGTTRSANPTNTWWIPAKTLESLRFCGESLERLQEAAERADAAPSPDAQSGYAQVAAMKAKTLAAWRSLLSVDLAALNRTLADAGLEPISAEAKPAS